MFYLKSLLNRDVFTIMLLETELILKLLVCYAIVWIYYFKYLFSILPNSQRISRYKDYGKKRILHSHIFKYKYKFQFLKIKKLRMGGWSAVGRLTLVLYLAYKK